MSEEICNGGEDNGSSTHMQQVFNDPSIGAGAKMLGVGTKIVKGAGGAGVDGHENGPLGSHNPLRSTD